MTDPENIPLKETLRLEARRHRARMEIDPGDADAVSARFFTSIQPEKSQVVGVYWPKGRELDTQPIIEELLLQEISCALPVVKSEGLELGFALWKEGEELVNNRFGIPEPAKHNFADPDILVVPMLAFDRKGYRLGQGGGYYDATLAALRLRKPITAVGVAYGHQACLFNLPVEPHDQKLDWVITPTGTHYFD